LTVTTKSTRSKKMASHSAQAHTCRTLSEALLARGFSEDELSQTLGVELSKLDDEELRVSLDRYYALWDSAISFTGDESLALRLAANNVMEGMGSLGHVFFSCKTLRSAIEHYQRYYKLINESIEVTFNVEGDEAIVSYAVKEGLDYSQAEMEYTLALAASRARKVLKSGLDIHYVAFQHEQPAYVEAYQETFRCPVKFGEAQSRIVFDASYLDYPMPRNSPSLYKVLTVHLDRLLSALGRRSKVSSNVESIVRAKISDPKLDADYVAERLNMSRNTLYRHLKKEGTSYNDIVTEVRSVFAKDGLSSGEYSVTELAFLLGFSEVSAFSRAFKRWTGKTPNAYVKGK